MNLRHLVSILRYPIAFAKFEKYGGNIRLGSKGKIAKAEEIKLGSNIFIAPNFYISARRLSIGSNVLIGPNLLLEGEDHVFTNIGHTIWETRSIKEKGFNTIENDVWIGGNVTILKNVVIAEGTIVGAGSVVTKSLPPYSICVGIPCKPIKSRFTFEQMLLHLEQINSAYSAEEIKLAWVKNKIL